MGDLKATPGPWKQRGQQVDRVSRPCTSIAFCGENGSYGVDGSYSIGKAEAIANARLIAAAPELYGALANLLSVQDGDTVHRKNAEAYAHTALAKARGEQPQSIREGMDRD